jgi:DNA-directed RNA polymerase specialized sigma24 family protein
MAWGISPASASLDEVVMSNLVASVPAPASRLRTPEHVIRCLVTYTDWWQPNTTSVLQIGASRSQDHEGFRQGLIDTLDERSEICRRMEHLTDRDRHLLFLWYVEQRPTDEIARALRISRRQCFRRKSRAIRTLVQLGEPDQAA